MDEYNEKKKVDAASGTAPAAINENNGVDYINRMYDAQKQSQLDSYKSAYEQSIADTQAAADKIPSVYQQQKNDLSAEYERQRRNFNEAAALSGINTGAGSQAALAQNNAYQRSAAAIGKAQADAQSAADQQIAQLKAQYQSAVAKAVSDNDYNRAQALYSEWNSQQSRNDTDAKLLASYGDFSGYARIYGDDTARSMAALWNAQNPDLAYNTGKIDAKEYKSLTGKYPAGYTTAKSSTASRSIDSNSGSNNSNSESDNASTGNGDTGGYNALQNYYPSKLANVAMSKIKSDLDNAVIFNRSREYLEQAKKEGIYITEEEARQLAISDFRG